MRDGDELRGSSASLSVAAKRSSVGLFLSRAIAFSRARRPRIFSSTGAAGVLLDRAFLRHSGLLIFRV